MPRGDVQNIEVNSIENQNLSRDFNYFFYTNLS